MKRSETREARWTTQGEALTQLILEIFKVNGRLLAAGDRLAAPVGLTSARWQVLGAIALASSPQPVASLARNMGLTRQAVQRLVNELEAERFVAFDENPHHQRAKLVVLTKQGREAFDAVSRLQAPWVNDLAANLPAKSLAAATQVLATLTRELDAMQAMSSN
jgi:DNA-binding MarR family transcriptional regulator